MDFWAAIGEHSFLRLALAAGLLASIACGVVGSFVVARRLSYIAGGIAHAILGGMGAARYLQVVHGWSWLHPLHGAVFAALAAALIIGIVTLRSREREDTVISALWAVGMAAGVLFIARTPGYGVDLMSYLFGNILMVAPGDLWFIAALDVIVVGASLLCYRQLLAVCFDEEFARLRGLRVEAYTLLLLCLTALTVVLLVTVVGLILVIALLTLPVAIAGKFTRCLWQVMALATVLNVVFIAAGLAVGYGANLPPGATTVLLAGAGYLLVAGGVALTSQAHRRRLREQR
jgi:zinc transport system permease protein